MRKSELRTGDIVRLKSSDYPYIVLIGESDDESCFINAQELGHMGFSSYKEDLTMTYEEGGDWDVIEVWRGESLFSAKFASDFKTLENRARRGYLENYKINRYDKEYSKGQFVRVIHEDCDVVVVVVSDESGNSGFEGVVVKDYNGTYGIGHQADNWSRTYSERTDVSIT